MCRSDDFPPYDPPTPVAPRKYVLSGDRPRRTTGRLNLTTPWAQQYLREPEARDRVTAAIPAGFVLSVGASRRPGDWVITLRHIDDPALDFPTRRPEVWRMRVLMKDLEAACLYALRQHEVTVTTDAAGYVVAIEEAS